MGDRVSEVYFGDCMDYMKKLPDNFADLAVVDPPYQGSDALNPVSSDSVYQAKRTTYHLFENVKPKPEYFIELKRVSKHQIVWGGNFFGLSGGVIAWNKHGTAFGEGEIAICSTHNSVRFFDYTWNGMIQQNMKNKEQRIHPTQKPIALYEWTYMKYLPEGGIVLDTHLGSGSNRIAADKMGNIDFYSCEMDEEYFNGQEKRFENHKSQPSFNFL